ncbi:unnamed protein product [Amoebophrya sp. A25]|nr:unnamed protein product [Amoebophrya sp. A25]|eukprot:GSA25T00006636001.1
MLFLNKMKSVSVVFSVLLVVERVRASEESQDTALPEDEDLDFLEGLDDDAASMGTRAPSSPGDNQNLPEESPDLPVGSLSMDSWGDSQNQDTDAPNPMFIPPPTLLKPGFRIGEVQDVDVSSLLPEQVVRNEVAAPQHFDRSDADLLHLLNRSDEARAFSLGEDERSDPDLDRARPYRFEGRAASSSSTTAFPRQLLQVEATGAARSSSCTSTVVKRSFLGPRLNNCLVEEVHHEVKAKIPLELDSNYSTPAHSQSSPEHRHSGFAANSINSSSSGRWRDERSRSPRRGSRTPLTDRSGSAYLVRSEDSSTAASTKNDASPSSAASMEDGQEELNKGSTSTDNQDHKTSIRRPHYIIKYILPHYNRRTDY